MRWLAALLLVAACAPDATPSGLCAAGEWQCDGTTARQCDGKGGFTVQTDCATTAATTCVPQLGCRVCAPSAQTCRADDPSGVYACNTDGNGVTLAHTCDTAGGFACSAGECMDRCAQAGNDYLGCDTWATVMANSQLAPSFSYAVVLANPQDYTVNARIEGGTLGAPQEVTLAPHGMTGDVQTIEFPWVPALLSNRPMCFDPDAPDPYDCAAKSADVSGGAYHVRSNGPIAVYQFNPLHYSTGGNDPTYSYTNDASLLLPTRALRARYLVATYANWTNDTLGIFGDPVTIIHGGVMTVVATGAGMTHVHLVLSAKVSDPASPYDTLAAGAHDFTLAQGEVLQLAGTDDAEDLSGTTVDADQPLAVFTGHDCTQVPAGKVACDHLEEQLLPDETWGQKTLVSQLRDRGPDETSVVKITSRDDGNALSFEGIDAPAACPPSLDRGKSCVFETAASFVVSGSKPFLVVQYMTGQGRGPHAAEICVMHAGDPECTDPIEGGPDYWCSDHANDPLCEGFKEWCELRPTNLSCVGDPAMVTEVPVDQYRASYDFLVPDTYVFDFLNITAPVGVEVDLDGASLAQTTGVTRLDVGTSYVLFIVPIGAGAHRLQSSSDGGRFGVKVYGVARYTSYAYPAGLDLAPISIY